jgi:hypothetical protein
VTAASLERLWSGELHDMGRAPGTGPVAEYIRYLQDHGVTAP